MTTLRLAVVLVVALGAAVTGAGAQGVTPPGHPRPSTVQPTPPPPPSLGGSLSGHTPQPGLGAPTTPGTPGYSQPGGFATPLPGYAQPGGFPSQPGVAPSAPAQPSYGQPGGFPPGGMWSWPPQTSPWPVQPGPQETVAPDPGPAQPLTPGVPAGSHIPSFVRPPNVPMPQIPTQLPPPPPAAAAPTFPPDSAAPPSFPPLPADGSAPPPFPPQQ